MVIAAVGNTSAEVLLLEGGSGLQLSCSGWSAVLGRTVPGTEYLGRSPGAARYSDEEGGVWAASSGTGLMPTPNAPSL